MFPGFSWFEGDAGREESEAGLEVWPPSSLDLAAGGGLAIL